MFTRPFMFNRPGKASTPFTTPRSGNPAGLRFPHRLKLCFDIFQGQQLGNNHPPQSSPFSSPVDADTSPLPDEDAPPRATIFDYFGLHASPPRPTGPIPPPKWPHQQKPSPRMTPTPAAPTTPPASTKPLPRKKMRHKQLTMNRAAIRSTLRKRHSRINVEAGLKKAQMHHERLAARARADLRHMRDEVNKTMRENAMSAEEKIFVEQLWKLHLDSVFRNDLSRHRETAERAEQETPARLQAHAEMDKEAARLREQDEEETDRQEELRVLRELREEREKQRQEEERARVEKERRQAREQRERLEHQRRLVEEQERKAREARERYLKELRERRAREREAREWEAHELQAREREARERQAREREARVREAREHEAREREARAREAKEREAREREARERAEQQRHAAAATQEDPQLLTHYFSLYEAKWAELRSNHRLTGIDVRELPWPTFKFKHFTPEEIEKNDVFAFILHVLRPVPSKSARDKVKTEVFRFHPDKFNALVLPKVREDQRELAAELAGAVVRVLNSIMEGVEKV